MKPNQNNYIIIPKGNVKRTKEYIKLLHSITSCENLEQLRGLVDSKFSLREIILKYYSDKKQDAPELLAEYLVKEHNLSEAK